MACAVLSLNELLFHLSRAAVGAGAPVGICEEFAETAAWLAFIGMDPARPALAALDALATKESSADIVIADARVGSADGRTASAIFVGPVIADRLAMAPVTSATLHLDEVDVPLLLAGAVALAGAAHVRLSWHGTTVMHIADSMVAATGNSASLRAAVTVEANAPGASLPRSVPHHAVDTGRQAALDHGIAVDGAAWSRVLAYHRKTLVPSSKRSRSQGAGPADET